MKQEKIPLLLLNAWPLTISWRNISLLDNKWLKTDNLFFVTLKSLMLNLVGLMKNLKIDSKAHYKLFHYVCPTGVFHTKHISLPVWTSSLNIITSPSLWPYICKKTINSCIWKFPLIPMWGPRSLSLHKVNTVARLQITWAENIWLMYPQWHF